MKKFVKIISAMTAIICLISMLSIFSSASTLVDGRFYHTDPQETAITETYGYSSGSFSGTCADQTTPAYAVMTADCRGGELSKFTTTLSMSFKDGFHLNHQKNKSTDSTGTRVIEDRIQAKDENIIYPANGYIEEHCISKTNSSDAWHQNYLYRWMGAPTGWVTY